MAVRFKFVLPQVVTLALMAPVGANAASYRGTVALHGVRTLGIDAGELSIVQSALLQQVMSNPDLTVTPADASAAQCKSDIHCHCQAARRAHAERALFANIGRIDRLYTFELVLVRAQDCTVETSIFTAEELEPGIAPAERLRQLTKRLLRPAETVSETAVKAERDINQTPASVTVFTAQQIKELGINTIEELLALVPGFESVDMNWGSALLHHGLPSTVLFMIDGVPLTNPMQNFRWLYRDLTLNLASFARVEVVQGPGSVLWGPGALLGVVNFRTKTAEREEPVVNARGRIGTLDTYELHTDVAESRRSFGYYLGATFNQSRGPVTYVKDSIAASFGVPSGVGPIWGNGGFTQNRPDRYYDVVARLTVLNRLHLFVSDYTYKTFFEISPFGSLLNADAPGSWAKSHRLFGAAWEDKLPAGFRYRLAASRYELRSRENFVVSPANLDADAGAPAVERQGIRALQGNDEPRVSHLLEARLYHAFTRGVVRNEALLGVSYLDNVLPDSLVTFLGVYEPAHTEDLSFVGRRWGALAGFAHNDLTFANGWTLSAGVRYEHRAPFPSVLSKQGALVAHLLGATGKLIYAEGFRVPAADDIFSTAGTKGNPNLAPEQSRSLSFEVERPLADSLSVRVAGSQSRIFKLITLQTITGDPVFASIPINQGAIDIQEASSELRWHFGRRLEGFANVSYKHLDESEPSGRGIPVAPWTAAMAVVVRPTDDASIFATASVISPRTVEVMHAQENPDDPGVSVVTVPTVYNTSVGVNLSNLVRGFDLQIKITNPIGAINYSPYRVDGRASQLLERRAVNEVTASLAWHH